ncbi:MAG: hypothetical protein ABJB11_09950 [Ferruginibacter sp.]
MQKGLIRFEFFLNQLQTLLTAAAKEKNPALWLYRNNARTPLFMLEALSKMYAELHNKKRFSKINAHFKMAEDALGAVDYYDNVAKDLQSHKKIPADIIAYLQAESMEKIQSLNEILSEDDWLTTGKNRLAKIHNKLAKADWLDEEKEIEAIKDYYGTAIYEITEFIDKREFHFENMEDDVHELRRKLRWLSIYPQALLGSIQLEKSSRQSRQLKKYCIPEITGSPYNKMPDSGNCKYLLLLDESNFYALSWMIAELGKIKDDGLNIIAVKEALQVKSELDDANAFKKTYSILGRNQTPLPQLLNKAESTSKIFFTEQNLEHLVKGIKEIGKP